MNFDLYSYQEKYRWIATQIKLIKDIVPIQYLDSKYVRTFLYGGSRVDKVFEHIFFSWLLNTQNIDQRDGKHHEFRNIPELYSSVRTEPNLLIRNHKVLNLIVNSQRNNEREMRYAKMDGYYTVVNTLASIIVRSRRVKDILSNSFGNDVSEVDNFNRFVDEVVNDMHLAALRKCMHVVLSNQSDLLVAKDYFFFRGMSLVVDEFSDEFSKRLSSGIEICRLILNPFDGLIDEYLDEIIEINDGMFQQELISRIISGLYFPKCSKFKQLNELIEEQREEVFETFKMLNPEFEEIEKISDLPDTAELDWDDLWEMDDSGYLPGVASFDMSPEKASRIIKKMKPKLSNEYEVLYARGMLVVVKYTYYGSPSIETWASDAGIVDFINNFR